MNVEQIEAGLNLIWQWTWETSLSASVLVGLVLGAQWLLRKRLPVRGRYALSCLILLRLLLPAVPVNPWGMPGWSAPVSATWAVSAPTLLPGAAVPPSIELGQIDGRSTPWSEQVKPRTGRAAGVLGLVWLAGMVLSLTAVGWQQGRFSRWLGKQPRVDDPELLTLLERAKVLMGVSQDVALVTTKEGYVPALCGWHKPCLLLPEASLERLDGREVELVLWHELAHLKRHDILLNWVLILVRAWHWFNPLVWLALRRLRADRELVCDTMVLRHLADPERRLYGSTLVKLLESVSDRNICPGLAPVVSPKHDMKRRIVMIAHYKTAGRAAWLLTASIVVVLCWLTFTRAAEDNGKAPPKTPLAKAPLLSDSSAASQPSDTLKILGRKLEEQRRKVWAAQERVDQLRKELGGVPEAGSEALDPETLRMLERERITVKAQKAKYEALRAELRDKSKEEFRQMLPTACPDNLLNSLLERLSSAETEQARLSSEFGTQSPQVKGAVSVVQNLEKQIDARVKGILAGISAQIAASDAYLDELKQQNAAATEKYRPYFLAKRDLDTAQRIYETLQLRVVQEAVDAELRSPSSPAAPE